MGFSPSDDNLQLQINSSSQHPFAMSPIFLPLLLFLLIWHHRSSMLSLLISYFIIPTVFPWLQVLLTHAYAHVKKSLTQ